MIISAATADELEDAHRLAVAGRDSYWKCLAREYSRDSNQSMSGQDFAAHLASGGIDWRIATAFAAAAIAGALLARRLGGRLHHRRLNSLFALLLVAVAVVLVVENARALV